MIDTETISAITQFLYREARLLDAEAYDEWLELFADDIHYWMPVIENRMRSDPAGAYGPERMAYFDDGIDDLRRRVVRFKSPSAWMESPATRHVHAISNVEIERTPIEGEFKVHSVFTNYRNRRDADEDLMFGRREDVVRRSGSSFVISKRLILLAQSVLLSKNINTFL